MTKKQNTIVFVLVGTLGSILLMLLLIMLFTVLGGLILKENAGTALPFLGLAAMILGMFLYHKIAKFIINKFNLEEKMDPIFAPKNKRNRLD